jgi:hypothetical protein
MVWFSPEYRAYIGPPASPAWQAKRQQKLRQAGNRCEGCGSHRARGVWLEVHHKTYARLGHERLSDLKVLCNGPNSRHCHDKATARMRRTRSLKRWVASHIHVKSWLGRHLKKAILG